MYEQWLTAIRFSRARLLVEIWFPVLEKDEEWRTKPE